MDLSSGNWIRIHEHTYNAQPYANRPGRSKPIPLIIVPERIEYRTIAIAPIALNGTSWSYGGKAFQIVSVDALSDVGGVFSPISYPLICNEALSITFDVLPVYYKLGVWLPKWFAECRLIVWAYTGTDAISSLETLAVDVNQIKADLIRIEGKLDNINTSQSSSDSNSGFGLL